jgi:phage repressor protein C with HTH and peptisase S24 domain/DNA-binding XRE family transcriptional regulator
MTEIGDKTIGRNNEIGEALRAARADRSIEALAKALDVNKNTLGDYERGVRHPEVDFLVRFAEVTGADLGRLLAMRVAAAGGNEETILTALVFTAQGNPELWRRATLEAGLAASIPPAEGGVRQRSAAYDSGSGSETDMPDQFSEFVLLRRRGLLGSAGAGAENVVIEPKGALAFRRDYLHLKQVNNPSTLIVTDIVGDSMERSLFHGDLAVFNSSQIEMVDDIYLFCLDARMFVKRLQYRPGNIIEVISDNKDKYAPFELTEGDMEAMHFRVLGKFFWRGGDRLQ